MHGIPVAGHFGEGVNVLQSRGAHPGDRLPDLRLAFRNASPTVRLVSRHGFGLLLGEVVKAGQNTPLSLIDHL